MHKRHSDAHGVLRHGPPFSELRLCRSSGAWEGGGVAESSCTQVSFADGTTLDMDKALGYKDVDTFCVAPIVDELGSPLVQFWAVGVNCCDARGGFECDDAWSPKARSGVVVHDDTGEYAAAIKMAQAAYSIASPEKYLLVRFVIDPETVEMNYWRVGVAFLFAGTLVSAVIFGLGALGVNLLLRGYASAFFR